MKRPFIFLIASVLLLGAQIAGKSLASANSVPLPTGWRPIACRAPTHVCCAASEIATFQAQRLPIAKDSDLLAAYLNDGSLNTIRVVLEQGLTMTMVRERSDAQGRVGVGADVAALNIKGRTYRFEAHKTTGIDFKNLVLHCRNALRSRPELREPQWFTTRDGLLLLPEIEGFQLLPPHEWGAKEDLVLAGPQQQRISLLVIRDVHAYDADLGYNLRQRVSPFLNRRDRRGLRCSVKEAESADLRNGWRAAKASLTCRDGNSGVIVFDPGGSLYALVGEHVGSETLWEFASSGRIAAFFNGPRLASPTDPLPPLPPLPQRPVSPGLYALAASLLIGVGGLGLRLAFSGQQPHRQPTSPEWPFPLHVERRYFSVRVTFSAKDAVGSMWKGSGNRPTLFLYVGIGLFATWFLIANLLAWSGGGVVPRPAWWEPLSSSIIYISLGCAFLGLVGRLFVGQTAEIVNSAGEAALRVIELSPAVKHRCFAIVAADGREVLRVRRRRFSVLRRHWEITDISDNVGFEIVEDSAWKSLARKLFGHVWGLLRTNYVIRSAGQQVGTITREWSIHNRFAVWVQPGVSVDPRLLLASALIIDLVDVDRWYPWLG